jgi:hypothetical protein
VAFTVAGMTIDIPVHGNVCRLEDTPALPVDYGYFALISVWEGDNNMPSDIMDAVGEMVRLASRIMPGTIGTVLLAIGWFLDFMSFIFENPDDPVGDIFLFFDERALRDEGYYWPLTTPVTFPPDWCANILHSSRIGHSCDQNWVLWFGYETKAQQ